MPVTLTAPVEGLQPGATYTGDREAWLLASGYAKRDATVDATNGDYTGPGVANTGPADIGPTGNPEFDATRPVIATGSDLPEGGTNDGVTTAAPPAPTTDRV